MLSFFLGIITGSILTKSSTVFGFNVYEIVDVFGQVFLNALKMIVIPLIMSSLIFNIAKFENVEGLSLISIKTVLFYILSSFAAILIGITIVNLVSPGFISTSMTESLNDDQKNNYLSRIPMMRFGNPKDVANLVFFLSSDDSSYITGQNFHVNGGMLMV